MKKVGLFGFVLIGAGLGLAVSMMTGGLPVGVKTAIKDSTAGLATARTSIDAAEKKFEAVLSKDRKFLSAVPEIKAAQSIYTARRQALKKIDETLGGQLRSILEKDASGDKVRAIDLAIQMREATVKAIQDLEAPVAQARRILGYKRDHSKLVSAARESIKNLPSSIEDTLVPSRAAQARSEYPKSASKITEREKAYAGALSKLQGDFSKMEGLLEKQPLDYVAIGRLADSVVQLSNSTATGQSRLLKAFEGLSGSRDKILIDMKDSGGRYYHKYKIVVSGGSRKTGWEEVSAGFYQRHRDHLGMTIYSKPEGVFEDEATTVAAPPGYAYVGNKRYGYWQERNGQSFWVFYGRYALFRDLFWGSSYYRPVYRRNWSSYRTSMRSGRAYYGPRREYGTSGTRTQRRYGSNSYFVRQRKRKAKRGPRAISFSILELKSERRFAS